MYYKKGLILKHMRIQPVADRVLVRPINEEETTKSGMLLSPVQDRMGNVRGIVVAIGDGAEASPAPRDLKVGSEVIYIYCSATELKVSNETFHVLRFNDIVVFMAEDLHVDTKEEIEALDKEIDEIIING